MRENTKSCKVEIKFKNPNYFTFSPTDAQRKSRTTLISLKNKAHLNKSLKNVPKPLHVATSAVYVTVISNLFRLISLHFYLNKY